MAAPISRPRPLARVAAGKVPPHDLDAEAAVLSTLLLDSRRLTQVQLRAADFYSEANGRIYSAIVELAADERAVDTVTVGGQLRDRQLLASIGGAAYLAQIVDATPSVRNVGAHAERVAHLARRRRLIDRAHRLAAEGYDAPEGWDAGAVRDLVDLVAEPVAPPEPPPDLIRQLWRPVGLAALKTRPEPRRWLLRHPTKDWQPCDPNYGDGMLPLGKAGLLAAEGGAGKTSALIQLAICVVTGRPWLGHFVIGAEARGRRVVLALAEEDAEEVDRRMYETCAALGLSDHELDLVARLVIVLPLAGEPVSLMEAEPYGSIRETAALASLRALLSDEAHPLALVVLDPLARWAGVDAESDSRLATRLIQAVESLTRCPGGPAVLVAHHSSKLARRAGDVDARGVTAITDNLRWAGTLRADGDDVVFRQSKSNYSRRMPHELRLLRGDGGVLRASTDADAEEHDRAEREAHARRLEADVERVTSALREGGPATSIDQIVARARLKKDPGRVAVREAIARGVVGRSGTARAPIFEASSVCVTDPPYPPGRRGVEPHAPAGSVDDAPGVNGASKGRRGVEPHWTDEGDPHA
jgi:hypothetical protein